MIMDCFYCKVCRRLPFRGPYFCQYCVDFFFHFGRHCSLCAFALQQELLSAMDCQ